MAGWKLFMTRATGFCQRTLRRYGAGGNTCPINGYHNAEVVVVPEFLAGPAEELGFDPELELKSDVRWPKECQCGYAFHPEDHWQVNVNRLYAGSPDGKLYTLRAQPPGAVWRAEWFEDIKGNRYAGPDGKVWAVQMPCMVEWLVYCKPENGQGWDILGELPLITVSPSIAISGGPDKGYHGYIKDGVISEDCEGREFKGLARTA